MSVLAPRPEAARRGPRGAAVTAGPKSTRMHLARVALARALAPKPGVLLLDEPFSSLDLETRLRLLQSVTEILDAERMTALLVTHDQGEAFAFADEVGVHRRRLRLVLLRLRLLLRRVPRPTEPSKYVPTRPRARSQS